MKTKLNRNKYFVGTKKLKHVKLYEEFETNEYHHDMDVHAEVEFSEGDPVIVKGKPGLIKGEVKNGGDDYAWYEVEFEDGSCDEFRSIDIEKEEANESEKPKGEPLSVKKGDQVWRLMSRYNPQLGMYHVFSKVTVTRVSGKSVSCDDDAVYDIETGRRKSKSTSVYGSSSYSIMDDKEAERMNKELKDEGSKVRGFDN